MEQSVITGTHRTFQVSISGNGPRNPSEKSRRIVPLPHYSGQACLLCGRLFLNGINASAGIAALAVTLFYAYLVRLPPSPKVGCPNPILNFLSSFWLNNTTRRENSQFRGLQRVYTQRPDLNAA